VKIGAQEEVPKPLNKDSQKVARKLNYD